MLPPMAELPAGHDDHNVRRISPGADRPTLRVSYALNVRQKREARANRTLRRPE
jgi:hypothetical protein